MTRLDAIRQRHRILTSPEVHISDVAATGRAALAVDIGALLDVANAAALVAQGDSGHRMTIEHSDEAHPYCAECRWESGDPQVPDWPCPTVSLRAAVGWLLAGEETP